MPRHPEVQDTPPDPPGKAVTNAEGDGSKSGSRSLEMKRYGNTAVPSIPRRCLTIYFFPPHSERKALGWKRHHRREFFFKAYLRVAETWS